MMALIDAIPENGGAGASPAPTGQKQPTSGGLIDLVSPQNQKSPQPASMHGSVPASPDTKSPAMRFFSTVDAYGTAWGPSSEKDTSGLPYLSYKPASVKYAGQLSSSRGMDAPDFEHTKLDLAPANAGGFNTKAGVAGAYPFTNAAKSIMFDKTNLVSGSTTLPKGVGGSTNLDGSLSGLTNIDVAKGQPPVVAAHELFHSLFERSNIDPAKFNATWEAAAKSNPDVQKLDAQLNSPKYAAAYHGNGENVSTDPYALATERFSLLGSLWGNDGVSSLPQELQKYYSPFLGDAKPDSSGPTTDYTRVATTFDPRKAQPLQAGSFTTPRAVANRAALKTALGGSYSTELDHAIALELAGSNNKANLRIEPDVKGTQNTATDPLENKLAKDVVAGHTSLFQAQWDLAKAKGTPLPYLGDAINKYEEQAYDARKASDYANSPMGLAENTVGSIRNSAEELGTAVIDHLRASLSSPKAVLSTAQGAVQTAIVKPAAFVEGIGSAIMHKEDQTISSLFGHQAQFDAPQGPFMQIAKMNTELPRSPDEQKAFDTGNFLGWMVPYGRIAKGAELAIGATDIAKIVPKVASLLPYISDAAGFLGTGQLLHTPDQGTRMDQLKNDAIALAFFDVGGWAIPRAAVGVAASLRKILPPAAQESASKIMKPIVDSLKKGETVAPDELEAATSHANMIIEDATGKTPQALIQGHLGLNESGSTIPSELQPLAEEAKKYKSAEEFVRAQESKYLYHGTNRTTLEAIKEQGIVPQRRGVSSLSTSEDYSKNWADNPWSNTKGVMFRVNKDALKGKTIPSKSGVLTDRQYEILTKETIPPNQIEVKTADGWKSLASDKLSPSKSQLEDLFNQVSASKRAATPATAEDVASKYWSEKIAPQMESGKTIEVAGDSMKEHFGNDYAPERSDLYSKASFQTVQRLLKDPSKKEFVFLGGGPGSGKSEFLGSAIKGENGADVLYDNSLSNTEGARKLLKLADENGKDVRIVAVLPDLDRAHGFTQSRATETGRVVSTDAFARGHAGFIDTLRTLLSDGTISPDQVDLYDFRNVKSSDEASAMVEKGDTVKDPLALLNSIGYTKDDLTKRYGKETDKPEVSQARSGRTQISKGTKGGKGTDRQDAAPQGGKIDLPELPYSSRVYGVAFPGANIIAKFIEKDIIEKFPSVRDGITGIFHATKDLFSFNPTRERAGAITGAAIQKVEQYSSSAWKAAENRRDWWAKLPEQTHIDFIHAMETGTTDTTKAFQHFPNSFRRTLIDMADSFTQRMDAVFKKEAAAGLEKNYIEDYFPHMWEDPDNAKMFFDDWMVKTFGANYKEAFGSYQKARTIDLIKVGLDAGLKLVTTNPEELVLMREIDGFRGIVKRDMMYELGRAGLARPLKNPLYNEGMPVFKGPDGRSWGVVPEAKKILDNAFFSKSLWSDPGAVGSIFRGFMGIKGTVVPFQLSLSGFHPFHVQTIASANAISESFLRVLNGNMSASEGLSEMGKGLSMIHSMSDVHQYWNVGKWWDTPMDQLTGEAKTTVQWLIDAGGSPKMSEEFHVRGADGFKGALGDENYIGAAIRGVPKMVELLQKPIFEYYVPSLKVAAFMRQATNEVKANPELLTNDLARKTAFRQMWKDMDSRFGEMVYKTKFWNPMMTQVGQASFLSLGWQLGFVDQFLGGALDLVKLAGKGVTGQATRGDVTSRMVFSVVYSMQSAMWGGLMTYAMTGKMPQSMQDLFYPQTGETNPDGSASRLNTPFYTREFFALGNHIQKEGLVGGPISMIKNKANPILTSLAAIYQNKDFYGYEIRNSDDSVAKQAAEVFKYAIENNFLPISIKGAQQAAPVTGRAGIALSIAGFNPAPKYISETATQTKIFAVLDQRTGGTKPLETKPAADAKNNIRKLYESGDIDGANTALDAAVKAGYIKPAGKNTFIKSLDLPADVRAFKSLTQFPSDQEQLLSQMSEEDLARYSNYATGDIKAKLSTLSPTAKKFVDDLQAGKIHLMEFKAGKAVPQSP